MDKELEVIGSWCELTEVGLSITGQPTWDEYQEQFEIMEVVNRASTLAIGDLLAYGEFRWGETYAQVSANTAYAPEYLSNLKYMCSRVPLLIRPLDPNITKSHYQAVASLETLELRQAWLEYASVNSWTRDQLREADKSVMPNPTLLAVQDVIEQMVILPEPDLRELVARYVKATRKGMNKEALEIFEKMETLVKDLL